MMVEKHWCLGKLGYHYLISNAMYVLLIPLLGLVSTHLSTLEIKDLEQLWDNLKFNLVSVTLCSCLMVFLATIYFMSRPRKIYLVNFSCYKPEPARMCTREIFMERSGLTGSLSEENLAFQKKILERSGLGQTAYLPDAVLRLPPNPCMAEARKEAEGVMFGAIDEFLETTKVKAKDIGILVVNCSLFNPTSSLSAMIVNHYKLRGNILSYNLGGMGCSAGLISIDLAKQLLQLDFCNNCALSMDNPVQKKPVNIRETIEILNSFLKRLSETRGSISSPKSGPNGDLQNLAENGGRRSETHDDGRETPKNISDKENKGHREEANENVGVEPLIPTEEVAQSRSGALTHCNNGGNDSQFGSPALPNNNNGGNDGNTDNPAIGGEKSTSTDTVCSFFKKLKKKKKKQENRNATSTLAGSRNGAEIGESNENLRIDQMSRNLEILINSLEGLTSFEEKLNLSIQDLQHQLERFLQRLKPGSIDSNSAQEISKEIKKLKNQIPLSIKLICADSNLHPSRHAKKALVTCLPNLPRKEIITDSKAYKEIKVICDGLERDQQRDKRWKCFLCFAVFPENEVIKRRLLTYWWLGENFIDSEKNAKEILDDFQAKGLIEPVITKKKREYRRFRMPPLVRCVAIDLARKEKFFDYDSDGNPTANFTECNRACLVNGKARLDSDLETKPENLEAIFNVSDPFPDLALEELSKNKKTIENNITVVEWVMKMKKLKVLFLGRWQSSAIHHIEVESTEFLQALKKMRELRFLSLQGISWINEIPRSIKSATKMRILDLKACHNLEVLPKEIGSLKQLTHLDISDCFLLDHLPRALSSLSKLQVLKGFVICSEKMRNSCSLPDLVALKDLRKLSIVSNRLDFPNAKELDALRTLGKSGALRKLTISWGWRLEQTVQPTTAKSKFSRQISRMISKKENRENPEKLPEELVKLDLICFPAESPLNWLMSSDFRNMEKLYIQGGRLSSLGEKKWESVKTLKLKYLRNFKSDWMKLREKFPNLIYLEKTNCPWVSFCPTDEHGVWQKAEEKGEELHTNAA